MGLLVENREYQEEQIRRVPEFLDSDNIPAVLAAFCAVNIAAVWASAWVGPV